MSWSREFDVDAGSPRWSSDSRQIVFVAGKRAYTEVFSFDLATAKYTQLSHAEDAAVRVTQQGRQSRRRHDGQRPSCRARCTRPTLSFASFRKLTDTNPQAHGFALGADRSRDVEEQRRHGGRRRAAQARGHTIRRSAIRCSSSRMAGPSGAFTNNYRVGGLEGGQLWAGQGWAVFYPNPRGSTNYGEKFLRPTSTTGVAATIATS